MRKKHKGRLKKWFHSLKESYHLTIINKDSFEEVYSTKVSKGKFYISLSAICVFIFIVCFFVISFTPIKKIVPGFESDEMHQELVDMKIKLRNMEEELGGKLAYSNTLDTILADIQFEESELFTENHQNLTSEKKPQTKADIYSYHFYPPVHGAVSQEFSLKNKHYGIDIVCNKNETVKAALPGKIIIALWSVEEGNIIAIQHPNNLITFYKHNSVLLKRKGDLVKAGDVISIVGNSGELSTGPHLHFEIWQNGSPVNPAELINFN